MTIELFMVKKMYEGLELVCLSTKQRIDKSL